MRGECKLVFISRTLLVLLLLSLGLTHVADKMLILPVVVLGGGVLFKTNVLTGTPSASMCFRVKALIREDGT